MDTGLREPRRTQDRSRRRDYGVGLTFIPILQQSLILAATGLTDPALTGPRTGVPPAFNTARVSNTVNDLLDQLNNLLTLAQQIQPAPF